MKKKTILIVVFVIIHLIATRFAIRLIDATVQINENYAALIAFVLFINVMLFFCFRKIYLMATRKK